MASELLLPLFPLEVVLLPGAALPLLIFEERYKLMIGQAIEQSSEFGVVLAKENSLSNAGCTAVVAKVARRYPDGRLDIVTLGRRRFELLFLDEQMPYLRGAVHFFDDEDKAAPAPESIERLASLFEKALDYVSTPAGESMEPHKAADSFQIAGIVPLDLDLKQRLLCMRSEGERVATLIEYLEKVLPRFERARRAEVTARGNGQGG
ncbi:MAG: LON peptidase substrate-binding domain-containing protein [Acidobacteria bacterium]|nr:LON peptidase substrate-binding domain-containing protein [Acidobacteriota bacterium]